MVYEKQNIKKIVKFKNAKTITPSDKNFIIADDLFIIISILR